MRLIIFSGLLLTVNFFKKIIFQIDNHNSVRELPIKTLIFSVEVSRYIFENLFNIQSLMQYCIEKGFDFSK